MRKKLNIFSIIMSTILKDNYDFVKLERLLKMKFFDFFLIIYIIKKKISWN
jgi:hypothetical protein